MSSHNLTPYEDWFVVTQFILTAHVTRSWHIAFAFLDGLHNDIGQWYTVQCILINRCCSTNVYPRLKIRHPLKFAEQSRSRFYSTQQESTNNCMTKEIVMHFIRAPVGSHVHAPFKICWSTNVARLCYVISWMWITITRLRTDSVKACNHMEFSVKRKNVEAAYQRFLGKNYPCDAIDVKKIFRISSWCEKR